MALNFLALANKATTAGAAFSPEPTIRAVLSVAKFVTGAAQKILQRKKDRAVRKAEEAKATAANRQQYANELDNILGKSSTVTGVSSSPIKTAGKLLSINLGGLDNKAMKTGAVLVPSELNPKRQSSMGLIIGIIAAVFLLPKLLKGR